MGLTALFLLLASLILVAFFVVPPLSDWLDGVLGPGQPGDAFGMGRVSWALIVAGGISCLVSLAIVLAVSWALKARPAPARKAERGD